jgi:U3 small nucleolar ribonucleoprotein protein IMP4
MERRNARLRREYEYRRSVEAREHEQQEKKRKLRTALAQGNPVPTELRGEDARLRREIELEDASTAIADAASVDDEYKHAREREPSLLLTTSREPSSRLSQFAKELKLVLPNCTRINRGSLVLSDLTASANRSEHSDLIIATEHRGKPDGLTVCHMPFGPTAFFGLSNCVLRHDLNDQQLGTISEAYPHIILDGFTSKVGNRIATILKHLFPEPKPKSKRIFTFANKSDYISFRHHTYERFKGVGPESVSLSEIGPRFEMRPYQVRLGTLEQDEAEIEWSLKPYMRSAKKPKL